MSLQTTGYTKDTPKYYFVDAGAIYKNLKYNKEKKEWEGTLLGATAEGNKVKIEQKYRQIKVDGVFTKAKGQEVLQTSDAEMEVNVKEVTAENIRLALNGIIREIKAESDEAPEGYTVVEGKGKLEDSDYIDNLALVGTMTGSNQPIIVILDNALCTSGLEFETKDDNEAVLKMKFEAHASADQVADRKLPARIYFPPINKEVKEKSQE
ncbi:hypothetical protein [Clostridium botulinum]|uniref:Uncharacterized protein n=1 Tax=Clostridium botulinum TaxID=1491 RepID=A0A9Q1UXI1_CLOBO|nr:hypothetical protein [Clostridium botulinum]AEB75901.1 conserved hypothetical protein [Clostridium botulinum BKT015925]KEH97213.1 hypothetical protein Z953_02670 [Clostridium botulinum D str. 16868]KEI04677.1 hypothetical protein Y848_00480 [Clostridium botulinum C/D str. Sp77]KLU76772.1 hypothetical protein CBC3_01895 [Clostridium botulinum V891]KOA75201.1 hypothetical protein ADU78_08415 [Clostridium botulinum]